MTETQKKIDDGGSWYPQHHYVTDTDRQPGVSVRLRLAGMAMQGLLANDRGAHSVDNKGGGSISKTALSLADAMIAASREDSHD